MTEYEHEPVPGLPGHLPAGERMIWQGSPDWRGLARTAFHVRIVVGYFALLAGWAIARPLATGTGWGNEVVPIATTLALGVIVVALLHLLAWAAARAAVYTLTDKRLVLRVGIAVPKCVNLPLAEIASVDLALHADGSGDLPLRLRGAPALGYAMLWPHARPWQIVRPAPMLRAVPDGARVAALVARTCLVAAPNGRIAPIEEAVAPTRDYGVAVAA